MKKAGLLLISLVILMCSGCGGYKLGSMTIGGIKTVSIEPIENLTGKIILEESQVMKTLIKEFNRDGSVKVVNKEVSDAVLSIILSKYTQTARTFSSRDVGNDFRIVLHARVELVSQVDKKILYKKQLSGEATYTTGLDQPEIERLTLKKAITDLSKKIVQKIVEDGW